MSKRRAGARDRRSSPSPSHNDAAHSRDGHARDAERVTDAGAADLLVKFLHALDQSQGEGGTSQEIWQLFVSDPWYQDQLRRCAAYALRVQFAPQGWLEDVQQEAMLLLARQLQRTADLHLDRSLAATTFAPWLRTIIIRHCLEAIRRMRRWHHPAAELRETDWVEDDWRLRDERADVSMAMEQLSHLERTVLSLYGKGYTLSEVAEKLDMSTTTAHRIVKRAIREVQRILASEVGP